MKSVISYRVRSDILGKHLLMLLCLLAGMPHSVKALTVFDGYTPNLHNRFEDWENGNYDPNPNITVASLTGLGWGPGYDSAEDLTYAAITNQHIIGGHVDLPIGTTIYFHGDNGSIISRTIQSAELLGGTMRIYTLDSPILDSSFQPIPVFIPGSAADFANMTVAMFGQDGRVVMDQLAPLIYDQGDLIISPWAYTDGTSILEYTDHFSNPSDTTMIGTILGLEGKYQTGDSNDAVLGYYNGQWGLLGTAYLTSNENTSYFDLLAAYFQNLPSGVNPTYITVPEPAKAMLLFIGFASLSFFRSRRRH